MNSKPLTRLIKRPLLAATKRRIQQQQQPFSSAKTKSRRPTPTPPPVPYPTVPTCPSPTCACAPTPALPPDVPPIDRTGSSMRGAVPRYAEHVLVCTGRDGWASKIESEEGTLATELKEVFGRSGEFCDPFHNISILNSSFPSPTTTTSPSPTAVYLLPSFVYIPSVPSHLVKPLAKGFLLPTTLHPMHKDVTGPEDAARLTADHAQRDSLDWRPVNDVVVLICGHGERDARCGILGPVLRTEFGARLRGVGVEVREGEHERREGVKGESKAAEEKLGARIGLISHIGGHKYAGNVIIYMPPSMKTGSGEKHPLAGCGVWYGRVEPCHAEGIVKETILGGRIVEELLRGGITAERGMF